MQLAEFWGQLCASFAQLGLIAAPMRAAKQIGSVLELLDQVRNIHYEESDNLIYQLVGAYL
jgi:hypothetical protein